MAAMLRKRKIIDTGFGDAGIPAAGRVTPAARQPRVQQFGRLSKPGVRRVVGKEITTTAPPPAKTTGAVAATATDSKKRKLELHDAPASPSSQSWQARPVTPPPVSTKTTTTSATTQRKARLPPSQPGETRRIAPLKKGARAKGATVAESPTQGARAILEAFVLAAPAPTTAAEVAQQKADASENNESHELMALHAAFLNALSLHYAHEGTSAPVDLRQLAGSITRIWGRRRVTTYDIRRVLGVQQWERSRSRSERTDLPGLALSDLGHGRICVEFEPSTTTAAFSHTSSPLPVATLKRIFAGNLLALDSHELPLAPITPYAPVSITSTTSGAARLADLKASALNAQANTARSAGLGIKAAAPSPSRLSPSTNATGTAKPASRGASLLARICAKEAHAAQQPAAPSAAAVARKAALQRLEEIIPVIEQLASRSRSNGSAGLSGGSSSSCDTLGQSAASADLAASLGLAGSRTHGATVSFTLPALVQQLQNSLRHPLAKEEGELCVRLLAAELLPGWVQVHALGGGGRWTSVSVRGAVRRGEWMERLRELVEEA